MKKGIIIASVIGGLSVLAVVMFALFARMACVYDYMAMHRPGEYGDDDDDDDCFEDDEWDGDDGCD